MAIYVTRKAVRKLQYWELKHGRYLVQDEEGNMLEYAGYEFAREFKGVHEADVTSPPPPRAFVAEAESIVSAVKPPELLARVEGIKDPSRDG